MAKRPGGALATRPLHFFWICDCSGSMQDDSKIQALNNAIRETIPQMRQEADSNPNAEVLVRVLKFSTNVQWHLAEPTPVANFTWNDLDAGGLTAMGKALSVIAEELKTPPMAERALPPVLVLITDGQPTDDFETGLKRLLEQPWGKKAVRIAIAIGEDADQKILQQFIGHNELKPLQANNAETLVKYIRWASTAILKSVSSPTSQTKSPGIGTNIPIPEVPPPVPGVDDVW